MQLHLSICKILMSLLFCIARAMLLLVLAPAFIVCPVAADLDTLSFIIDFLRFQRPPALVSAFVCWKQGIGDLYHISTHSDGSSQCLDQLNATCYFIAHFSFPESARRLTLQLSRNHVLLSTHSLDRLRVTPTTGYVTFILDTRCEGAIGILQQVIFTNQRLKLSSHRQKTYCISVRLIQFFHFLHVTSI